MRSILAVARPLSHINQDVGRNVLGRKDGLGAAIGVGSDKLERTAANAGDALVPCSSHYAAAVTSAISGIRRQHCWTGATI